MSNLETRMMLDNLRYELTNFKIEVRLELQMNLTKQADSSAIADMLTTLHVDICSDLESLKKR